MMRTMTEIKGQTAMAVLKLSGTRVINRSVWKSLVIARHHEWDILQP